MKEKKGCRNNFYIYPYSAEKKTKKKKKHCSKSPVLPIHSCDVCSHLFSPSIVFLPFTTNRALRKINYINWGILSQNIRTSIPFFYSTIDKWLREKYDNSRNNYGNDDNNSHKLESHN